MKAKSRACSACRGSIPRPQNPKPHTRWYKNGPSGLSVLLFCKEKPYAAHERVTHGTSAQSWRIIHPKPVCTGRARNVASRAVLKRYTNMGKITPTTFESEWGKIK